MADKKYTDSELWKAATQDVKRLPGRKYARPAAEKSETAGVQKPASAPMKKPDAAPARGTEVDRRTDEKLRRGKMKIDARLDLHGLNQREAHAELNEFLLNAYERGKRCVLVITGKGSRSREEGGVLKRKVPQWMEMPQLRNIILKVYPAKPAHGGDGAIYVLLRRRRD